MESKVSYALVGAFVILLSAAGIAGVMWLGFAERAGLQQTFVAYMTESVSGLRPNAPVRFLGVDVGRVTAIALDRGNPERVRLTLTVDVDTPVRTDTVAVLKSVGLTGIAHVELTAGTRAAAPLVPDPDETFAEIRTGPSLFLRVDTMFTKLVEELQQASEDFRVLTGQLTTLVDQRNIESTAGILRNLRTLSDELAAHAGALGTSVDNAAQVSASAAQIASELPTMMRTLNDTLAAFQQTAGAIAATAGETRGGLKQLTGSTLPDLSRTLSEMRTLAETLHRVGREVERDPAVLLRGRTSRRPGPGEPQ